MMIARSPRKDPVCGTSAPRPARNFSRPRSQAGGFRDFFDWKLWLRGRSL